MLYLCNEHLVRADYGPNRIAHGSLDLLGNRVSSSGFESLFEPGNKAVPISLHGLAAGTYFARVVTAYGEVQTVKLVKE
jgi:hypothetical protein